MKPIKFSVPMVQAILEGRKSQTRRAFKFKMRNGRNPNFSGYSVGEYCTDKIESGAVLYSRRGDGCWEQVTEKVMPRYLPENILWVRETWKQDYAGNYIYKADYSEKGINDLCLKFKPSIHMPKEAARIFLRVTDVRAERLQEISEADAIAEGITLGEALEAGSEHFSPTFNNPDNRNPFPDYKGAYQCLWNSLNAKRGYGWDSNPWVWVIEFERIEKLEETGINGAIDKTQ